MQLSVGWTYKFYLSTDFSSLDGIYSVVKIYSYDELLTDGIDLYTGLYSKVNKTEDQLDSDISNYLNDDILKLVSVEDETVIHYVPSSILANTPDPNIKKYSKLVVGLNVGIYTTDEELNYVKDTIQQLLQATLGYTELPKVFTIGYEWLTQVEYDAVVANRLQTKTETVNYYSENIRLRNIIDKQKSTIDTLQQFITQMQDCLCG